MNKNTLQRYIEGGSDKQERDEVVKWLDADEKNMQEFLLLRSIYDATLWNPNNIARFIPVENEKSFKDNKGRKIIREILKIAAVFILGIGCYHLFTIISNDDSNFALQTIYAPGGQRAEIVLSDGTKVWLNAKSGLTFPDKFGKNDRIVELTGEAYFDVTHDEKKQFIVKTDAYQVKVYGTEFDVTAYNDKFETALIEGSVEVISNATNQSMILLPNTKAYVDNDVLLVADLGSADQFLWKRGILNFENEYVKDIIEKLELYYDVKVEVRKPDILDYQYTGKFWINDGIEHVFKVMQLRQDFKYYKDEMNNIIIY